MTHYRPPTGYALAKKGWQYHLVRDGQYESICPAAIHFGSSDRRIATYIATILVCGECLKVAEVEATE